MHCVSLRVLCLLYGELLLGLHESPAHLLLQFARSLLHNFLCRGGGTVGRRGGGGMEGGMEGWREGREGGGGGGGGAGRRQ